MNAGTTDRLHCVIIFAVALLIAACSPATGETRMPSDDQTVTLAVHLQDGFNEDTVVLTLNGEEVFRKEQITYSPLLGYADVSFEQQVNPGPIELQVQLPERGWSGSIDLEPSSDTYIGVFIANGEIQFTPPSQEPFGYG
jgi:hypothetical protein